MNEGKCCPENSHPEHKTDYKPKGSTENIGDIPTYIIGETTSKKAVFIVPDIFGPEGGRTKYIADLLSTKGYFVILPDLIRGNWYKGELDMSKIMELIAKYPWSYFEKDLSDKLIPFLKSKGIQEIGMLGYCWGSWYIFKACSTFDYFKCGVNNHPSLGILGVFNENIEEVTKAVKCRQLLFPAGNDDENVKENGVVLKILRQNHGEENSNSVTFKNMLHGWVVRPTFMPLFGSKATPEEILADSDKAIELTVEYFKKNL